MHLMQETLSTKLNRLAETARKEPEYRFRTLAHLINVEMLGRSFLALRRDAASGIDEVSWKEYRQNLSKNLINLHERMREGRYKAQALRRVYIPKGDGKERPLSIPVIEDKIAQKAVVEILNRIYEQDFLNCSYGYREGRNAHEALGAIQKEITLGKVRYVLEADIEDYFGNIVRRNLMEMLRKRIAEESLLRLIGKWLHVGVLEEGRLLVNRNGIHQGSVISPLLANIYLHEVLDKWIEREVKPRMQGEVKLHRFADDFVILFETKTDAERVQQVLTKRFEKYGLKLHTEKTKLIEFGRSAWSRRKEIKPQTFNFLGFTHICGTSRKGKFTVKVKTMKKRLSRSLKKVSEWCKRNRHQALPIQAQRLREILRGHYNYYGRRCNYRSLVQFYRSVLKIWQKWLGRRTRDGKIPWQRFAQLLTRYSLPLPRITKGTCQLPLFGELI